MYGLLTQGSYSPVGILTQGLWIPAPYMELPVSSSVGVVQTRAEAVQVVMQLSDGTGLVRDLVSEEMVAVPLSRVRGVVVPYTEAQEMLSESEILGSEIVRDRATVEDFVESRGVVAAIHKTRAVACPTVRDSALALPAGCEEQLICDDAGTDTEVLP